MQCSTTEDHKYELLAWRVKNLKPVSLSPKINEFMNKYGAAHIESRFVGKNKYILII